MTNSTSAQKIDQAASKSVLASVNEDNPLPVAVFKNSLLEWRARWKAKNTTQNTMSGTKPNQTEPA